MERPYRQQPGDLTLTDYPLMCDAIAGSTLNHISDNVSLQHSATNPKWVFDSMSPNGLRSLLQSGAERLKLFIFVKVPLRVPWD